MVDDGLIPHPPQPARAGQSWVIAWFLLLTAVAGLVDGIWPPAAPRPAGAEGRQRAQLRANARVLDGTRMQVLDQDFADRSNLRAHLTPWYAGALITLLDEAGSEAVVGKEGWLFLERRTHPPVSLPEETTLVCARAFASVDRELRRRNSRLIVMPVPRRAVACKEFLPRGFDPDRGFENALHASLAAEGLDTVDLRPVFAQHEAKDLFYRQDTHWNRRGQWLAARAVHEYLGTLASENEWRDRMIDVGTAPDRQGLLNYGGVETGTPAQRFWQPKDVGPAYLFQDQALKRDVGPDVGPLAVTGTSFSVGENFLGYLRLTGTQPIFKAAQRGIFAWESMDRYLRGRPVMHGALLIEQLVDQILPTDHRSTEQEYMRDELQFLTALPGRDGPNLLADVDRVAVAPSGHAQILVVPGGLFLSTCDGALSIRLPRPPEAQEDLQVITSFGGVRWSTTWSASRPELHLPLIGLDPNASEIRISIQGQGAESIDPDSMRVVTDFDLMFAVELQGAAAEQVGSTRQREFDLPVSEGRPKRVALRYRQPQWEGKVEIDLVQDDGSTRRITSGFLGERGQVLADLHPHLDTASRSIRVTTHHAGGPTMMFRRGKADSASLVPLVHD